MSTPLRTLSLALSAVLAMGIRLPAQGYSSLHQATQTADQDSRLLVAGLRFRVRGGSPGNRVGGASRGTSCSSGKQPAMALLPSTKSGSTISASPTLFVNLPQSSTKLGEFALTEDQNGNLGKEVYRTTLEVPSNSGVVSISLPKEQASSPLLEVGKTYHWEFSLVCDSDDRAKDVVLDGWIKRVELSSTVASQLEKAAPKDRPAIYAEADLWYDTVASLAQLRQANPNDPKLSEDWQSLLQSVNLDPAIAQAPLAGSLTQVKN